MCNFVLFIKTSVQLSILLENIAFQSLGELSVLFINYRVFEKLETLVLLIFVFDHVGVEDGFLEFFRLVNQQTG